MSAAAAEQIFTNTEFSQPIHHLVEEVPGLSEDLLVRKRAARFIGECLADREFTVQTEEVQANQDDIGSLFDAIRMAGEGHVGARKMVETNVRTDVIERTIKTGHVIKVGFQVDENGNIQQHGQKNESIQANSLRMAANSWQMRERTEAETTNSFRIKQYFEQGKLDDYCFVVFSRAADNMSGKEMADAGFFTDTMSCAIQVTTVENGTLTTESAFVSGVKSKGGERHDEATITAIGEVLGVDFKGKSATETINTPILIHKSLMSNGAIDLVELYDICAGGTFFGEDKPTENYLEFLEKCKEREEMFRPKVDAIVQELIDESSQIDNPLQAVRRLHKISEKHMVEQAVFDATIDPQVFGAEAAQHIHQARIQFEMGNFVAGLQFVSKAKETADSKSCPSGLDLNEINEESKSSDTENEECEFVSKECPMCGKKNVPTKVTKNKIEGKCGCSARR